MAVFAVIPAFREAELLESTIASIASAYAHTLEQMHSFNFRLILVINRPSTVPLEASDLDCLAVARTLSQHHSFLTVLNCLDRGFRCGVGEARDFGFRMILDQMNPDPLDTLLSMDADTQIPNNYFLNLLGHTLKHHEAGFLCNFQHPISGTCREAIAFYELYLKYLIAGLVHAKAPHAFMALGSCIGTNVKYYKLCGGFPHKSATEDFHFVNKLRKYGDIKMLRDVVVHPSSRISCRVSLGTGYFLYLSKENGLASTAQTLMFPTAEDFNHLASLFHGMISDFRNNFPINMTVHPWAHWIQPALLSKIKGIQNSAKSTEQFTFRLSQVLDGLQTFRILREATKQRMPLGLNGMRTQISGMLNLTADSFIDMCSELHSLENHKMVA